MTYVLGLTGGIASGKSTVSNYLYEQGAVVIDADIVSRQVVRPGAKGLLALVSEFGKQIQNEDGTLNRAALGEIIFNDQKKRDVVNGLLHPLIKEEMLNQVKVAEEKAVDLVVLDIPLLFESKCEQYCDAVLVVDVSPETQKGRLMRRNDFTQKEAQARIDSQMDPAERKKRADFVVDNDASEEKTYQQVDILLEDILN
ncbi:dephospho-CoA kinase [Ligilactobacillus pobuzihii]|uniref:dephospho-CoA kinase n=1 Tax=Ligilactobacillus pobuzihii TaxID=449659 RepID=UPI0019D30EC0|nr:dephospho-CoA kinase [Ligilactobacillus pobuzihii]MBN7273573.1 dephospho-CoA kinase [Ligilactobacillus pobuzihii]